MGFGPGEDRRVAVTGGAGFVGSHLAERLVDVNHVTVIDDFSSGRRSAVPDGAAVREADLADGDAAAAALDDGFDVVFHCAAESDVRDGLEDPRREFERNAAATLNVLEAIADAGTEALVFTSTSTVYGEDVPLPTPETHGPLTPISPYGASKLACEGYCTAYEATEGIDAWIYRFANVVGPRCHGVVPDFVDKLRRDPERLEILGNGEQRKSYCHVDDCVDGILHGLREGDPGVYNLGSGDAISVDRVARAVADVMDLDPAFDHTGGDRGWPGDVPEMRLAIDKLRGHGWAPERGSAASVRRAAEAIVEARGVEG